MGKLFDLDSPLMRALSRMADLIGLNLLVLIFFIPAMVVFYVTFILRLPIILIIALTWAASLLIGPALTGMHYVLLKMVRNEEGYLIRSFFKSFRENFRQSMILAAVVVTIAGLLAGDIFLMTNESMGGALDALKIPIIIVTVYLFMVSLWIFPVESRFVNSVPGTVKNAFFMSILAFPRTFAMAAITLLPLVLYYFFDLRLLPILLMFGISAPAYVCANLYSKVFKRFEPADEASDEEDAVTEEDSDDRED